MKWPTPEQFDAALFYLAGIVIVILLIVDWSAK